MQTITINIDSIRAAIANTDTEFAAEFATMDDTRCRVWMWRLELMVRKCQAASAILRMTEDAARVDGEWDGMGDVNGNLIAAMAFDSSAKHYTRQIEALEYRERELRGVAND